MIVCLAAGQGKRMKPLSNYLHKAMIPFSGVPFLAYSVLAVPERSRVVFIVSYLAEQIVNYFGNYYKGRHIEYFWQRDPKGTGDALSKFSEAYQPKDPVIVWQADQMIFPDELAILAESEPNTAICCGTNEALRDVGFWKIKPSTLTRLNGHFDGTEYRALPALEKEGLNRIRVQREKLEISFNAWEEVELRCKLSKSKCLTESRWSVE